MGFAFDVAPDLATALRALWRTGAGHQNRLPAKTLRRAPHRLPIVRKRPWLSTHRLGVVVLRRVDLYGAKINGKVNLAKARQ
jgi:hypothetical protein